MEFASRLLERGTGRLVPLFMPTNQMEGPSMMNPSVLSHEGKLYCNLRNVNYTLYHANNYVAPHEWGPLIYIHPENDVRLQTWNYIAELSDDLEIEKVTKVDTSLADVNPIWEFVGLEDGRLIHWDGKFMLCGVRRDTTTNGQGRMEYTVLDENWKEVERIRINTPVDNTYCEKNWIPIIDQPHRFVKWSRPVEIVDVRPQEKTPDKWHPNEYRFTCPSVQHKVSESTWNSDFDWRGSSQAIPFEDGYLYIVHETNFYYDEGKKKNADYKHRFIFLNKDFEIESISERFSFLGADIEFCCGMTEHNGKIIISFGYRDNIAYLLETTKDEIFDFIYG